MEFSRQEYWSNSLLQGIFPIQGSNPGIEPRSPAVQADSLISEPRGKLSNDNICPKIGKRSPGWHSGKEPSVSAGDTRDVGSIPGSGRAPGVGNGNPLQSCLENSIDRGAWWATVHGVTKSWIRLSREQDITQVCKLLQ